MEKTITIKEMRSIVTSPFFSDLTDEKKTLLVNSSPMSLGYWNLICSIRDVSLYSKGIKVHRNWKITDVKNYFGLRADATTLASKLKELRDIISDEAEWEKYKIQLTEEA